MKVANVSTTNNSLSSILAEVRQGESYLSVDRDVPVERILACLEGLAAYGVVRLPETTLDVDRVLGIRRPTLRQEASAVDAIGADRDGFPVVGLAP